jgi:hypothetical protein
LVFVSCLVGLLTVRLLRDGQAALRLAEGELAAGPHRRAVATRAFEHALRAYLPGAAHVARAVAGLEAVAAQARAEGRLDDERVALSSLRAGLLGARWVTIPLASHAQAASLRLATLTGTAPSRWWPPPAPRRGPIALGFAGIALMAVALTAGIARTFTTALRPKLVPALVTAVLLAVGLILFMVGMRLA